MTDHETIINFNKSKFCSGKETTTLLCLLFVNIMHLVVLPSTVMIDLTKIAVLLYWKYRETENSLYVERGDEKDKFSSFPLISK